MCIRTNRLCLLAVCLFLGRADNAMAVPNILLSMSPVIAARDVTPDPIIFTPKSNVPKRSKIKSAPVIVTGFNRALPVELSIMDGHGGCYVSVDKGPLYPALIDPRPQPGPAPTVSEGQQIVVTLWSSKYNGTSRSCTVKIGETASTFTVTTAIPPPVKTCASGPQTVEWQGEVWQRCDNGWDYTSPVDSWNLTSWKVWEYCDNLNLGGYYDWRVPSPWQLATLIVCDNGNTPPAYKPWFGTPGCAYDNDGNYYGPYSSPTIAPVFQAEPTPYWSWFNDIGPGPPGFYPVYVKHDFATGAQDYNGPYDAGKIRCVRRGYP